MIKRLFDLVISSFGIILLSPILLLFIVLIKLESPGTAIFKQQRVGEFGRVFTLYKLRSMKPDKRLERDFDSSKDEQRITKLGAFIRRTKLDEIPQLLNVFLGDMSLVGPRPTIQKQVDHYTARQKKRLAVKPGLTGLAQINGNRFLTWDERIEYDLQYIENRNLLLDLQIILKTFLIILFGEKKYLRPKEVTREKQIKLMFLGATKTSYSALEALLEAEVPVVVIASLKKVGNAPSDRKRKGDLKSLALSKGIPHYEVESNDEIMTLLQQYQPDAIFAISWPKIIRQDVLQFTPLGCIGFHPTPLPKRRGGAPLNWLMIDGESESQLTLFKMQEGIDNGPILLQKPFVIDKEDYISDVLNRVSLLIKELVVDGYKKLLANGCNSFTEQDEDKATYTWRRTPIDGHIHWNDSTLRIYNFIRGLSHPFPGAFSFLDSKKLTVWRAEKVNGLKLRIKDKPGTILPFFQNGVIISTRDYCLRITEFEYGEYVFSLTTENEMRAFVEANAGKRLGGGGMGMNVLVIATHADDEVLGVGGTLALHAKKGDHITICTVCEADPDRRSPEYLAEKRMDTLKAHQILGVTESIFLDYHATKLDTVMHRDLIADLDQIVERVNPDIVYTHFWGDVNKEHRVVNEAMQVVLRPKGNRNKIKVLSYEVLSSTEWGIFMSDSIFKPNYFVDVTSTLDIKKRALGAYKTEKQTFPHPRSVEAIDASAMKWGSVVGIRAVEPFILVRETIIL